MMEQNTRLRRIAVFIFACSILSSCASAPPHDSKLDQAYFEYDSASHDNAVKQAAPEQLQKASDALKQATDLLKKGAPQSDVEHYAYLAQKRVEIAKEKTQANAIQAEIKKTGAERDKFLLESRQERIAQLREQVAEQKAEANAINEKLKKNKAQQEKAILEARQQKIVLLREELSKLKAKETNRGLVLTLGSVLFDVNKATLKSGAMNTVDKLAQFMKNDPKRNVMIEGYTDSTGSAEWNKRLSRHRAEAVRDALVNQGINPQRIVTKGYGAKYPVATNKNSAGRQENRRVEVVISDEKGNFPKNR
ncbi:MAG: OmpA family protein [Leptospirales bacterium]